MSTGADSAPRTSRVQGIGRFLLAAGLLTAGVAHLLWARYEFRAQVPSWLPVDDDLVVVASGAVEIVLGIAARFAPQSNVFLIGLPVKIFAALASVSAVVTAGGRIFDVGRLHASAFLIF